MGTNFYFFTNSKEIKNKLFGSSAELTDEPELGYKLHLAKTSHGWLPLFQASEHIHSVSDMVDVYFKQMHNPIKIVDEYGKEYSWSEFTERVIKFNGGTVANRKLEPLKQDKTDPLYDPNLPQHIPISHFEYRGIIDHPDTAEQYYKDKDGYEFCNTWFS